MEAEKYLKELNEHSSIFDLAIEYEFTEKQTIDFANMYANKKLKDFAKYIANEYDHKETDLIKEIYNI